MGGAQSSAALLARPVRVLVIDDNALDTRIIVDALGQSGVDHQVDVACDGASALALLEEAGHAAAGESVLVILDLNLPGVAGQEILATIRSHPTLTSVPVVVLTSSSASQDIAACYALRASCFVSKPVNAEAFSECVRSLVQFWLSVAQLPTVKRP